MSRLRLQFRHDPADCAVASMPMELIGQELQVVRRGLMRLGDPLEVEVSPGVYLVRVHMPSGEMITEQTSVAPYETKDVVLESENPSPRETLTWAYALKSVFRTPNPLSPQIAVPFVALPAPTVDLQLWQQRGDFVWHPLPDSPQKDHSIHFQDPRTVATFEVALGLGQFWLQVSTPGAISKFAALPPASRSRVLLVGSSRVDLQACKLEYSIVSPK